MLFLLKIYTITLLFAINIYKFNIYVISKAIYKRMLTLSHHQAMYTSVIIDEYIINNKSNYI